MGFQKPDLRPAYDSIRRSLNEIHSAHNDGFVQMSCKHELYQLKCWLDDRYNSLDTFAGEELWEQERIVQLLKR